MKNILKLVMVSVFACMLILSSCKREKTLPVDFSGEYILRRNVCNYNYKSDYYKYAKTNYKYFTYVQIPNCTPNYLADVTAVVYKNPDDSYSFCAETCDSCGKLKYTPSIIFEVDSVDFGHDFHFYNNNYSIYKMKGVRTETGFKGDYLSFYTRDVNSTPFPENYMEIGTFELIKK